MGKTASRFYVLINHREPYFVIEDETNAAPAKFPSLAAARLHAKQGMMSSHLGYTILEWNDFGLVKVHDD